MLVGAGCWHARLNKNWAVWELEVEEVEAGKEAWAGAQSYDYG